MKRFDISAKEARDRMDELTCNDFVLDGSVQSLDGKDMYRHFETATNSRHLSFIFNLFVFLQIFNMLGARKINDEFNIFEGIFNNWLFMTVWTIIFVGQIAIMAFGRKALKVHEEGITLTQWILSVGLSFISLFVNLLLKVVPEKFFPELGDEKEEDVKAAETDYANLKKFRKTRELSGSIRQGNFIQNKEGGSFK